LLLGLTLAKTGQIVTLTSYGVDYFKTIQNLPIKLFTVFYFIFNIELQTF